MKMNECAGFATLWSMKTIHLNVGYALVDAVALANGSISLASSIGLMSLNAWI